MKQSLGEMDTMRFVTGNMDGVVSNVNQVHNMKREAKNEEAVEQGYFGPDDVPNILRALEKTEKADQKARRARNDRSNDHLGVVRKFELRPTMTIELADKSTLRLLCELSERNRLVVSLDSTGGMHNYENTEHDGKWQHTRLTVQPMEAFLSAPEAALGQRRDWSLILALERLSPSNTGERFGEWIRRQNESCKEISRSAFGREIDLQFTMLKVDCALELLHGVVDGLRRDGMIRNARQLCSVTLWALLCHEKRTEGIVDASAIKASAMDTVECIRDVSPLLGKQCNSHVYLAMKDGRKNMERKPPEVRLYSRQIDAIFGHWAAHLNKDPLLARVLVHVALICSIFERKTVKCPEFTVDSATMEHHDPAEATRIAERMKAFIEAESAEVLSLTDAEKRDESIAATVGLSASAANKLQFEGMAPANRLVPKMNEEMEVAMVYLHSVDKEKKEGVVHVVYVYSPYARETDGSVTVAAQLAGGMSVTVPLPFTEGIINSPLHSERCAEYWRKWGTTAPLWAHAVLQVAEAAYDLALYASNNSAEGGIRADKRLRSDFKTMYKSTPALINRRWSECKEKGRTMVQQQRLFKSKKKNRERAAAAKAKSGPAAATKKKKTVKKKRQQGPKEKTSEMPWGKDDGKKLVTRLEKAFRAARRAGLKFGDSRLSKLEVITAHATSIDVTFMKKVSWNSLMKGEKVGKPKDLQVIESFCDKYLSKSGEGGDGENDSTDDSGMEEDSSSSSE